MTISRVTLYFARVLFFPVITGVGTALAFTVLENNTSWTPIFVGIVAIAASPLLAGWLSSNLATVALFPTIVIGSLAIAWAIDGPLSQDSNPIGFILFVGVIYGGLASAVLLAGLTLRRYLHRLRP